MPLLLGSRVLVDFTWGRSFEWKPCGSSCGRCCPAQRWGSNRHGAQPDNLHRENGFDPQISQGSGCLN